MILLDTDHVSVIKYSTNAQQERLLQRFDKITEPVGTTIITIEEQFRGWLAEIARKRKVIDQLPAYEKLSELIPFFSTWKVLPFDRSALKQFEKLKKLKLGIGTMDMKIASITLTNDCLLLTANTKDFEPIPGLRFDNWLKP